MYKGVKEGNRMTCGGWSVTSGTVSIDLIFRYKKRFEKKKFSLLFVRAQQPTPPPAEQICAVKYVPVYTSVHIGLVFDVHL